MERGPDGGCTSWAGGEEERILEEQKLRRLHRGRKCEERPKE